MDPENVRTIVTGIVTATVAIVPAALLYRQNRQSGDRDERMRNAERRAEAIRRRQEMERESLRIEAEGRESAAHQHRERYARFLRVVQQIDTGVHNAAARGQVYVISEPERVELAHAFEDLMLDASLQMTAAIETIRSVLDAVVEKSRDGGDDLGDRRFWLSQSVGKFRTMVREELKPRSDVNSELGQEPTTP